MATYAVECVFVEVLENEKRKRNLYWFGPKVVL
jgi:hypothetical protein